MKELVVLDEEGKEPWVRCWHAACDLLPEAKTPKRRRHHPWIQKEVPPERQHPEATKAAPRPWNSCHYLAAPPDHPPAGSAPEHQASTCLPRAVSLSHFPSSRLPVAAPRQPPLLIFTNQSLGLAAYQRAALNSSTQAPSRLPRPTHRPAQPDPRWTLPWPNRLSWSRMWRGSCGATLGAFPSSASARPTVPPTATPSPWTARPR
ncbi:uncharacterized protein LOC119564884 [Chelonia mydas]|uniref:uncharacterized protein LOC119564884 n=1 Tax=Chelonia mydas TaxID=8469 RepID=UPI001CA8BD76|nr:uncharacterized protein LOC119564884 [Chelonia mydas]